MNFRKMVEERILFILLTYEKELISDNTVINSFDIIRKHSLTWEDFSEKVHQDIFKGIQNQMAGGLKSLDLSRLVEFRPKEYKVFDQQASTYLSLFINIKNVTFAPFSELDQLIYKLKEFILTGFWLGVGQRIMSTAFSAINVIEYGQAIVDQYNSIYNRITNGIIQSDNSVDEMVNNLANKMEKARQGIIGGIPIPVRSIQNILQGFNEPDLIIIGGRPSMGKTETALSFGYHAGLKLNIPTLIVSIEMSKQQLTNKIVAAETGINANSIKHGQLTSEQFLIVANKYKEIEGSALTIISGKYKVLENLIQKCRDLHKIGQLKLLIIDYLQLMKTMQAAGNRDQYIGIITGELKGLCLELNIPIILLSQLNRAAANKAPSLEDLRESGNIEQDADIVAFVHRPTFYQGNYDTLPYEEQFKSEFVIRKHRGGELGTAHYFQDVKNSIVRDID